VLQKPVKGKRNGCGKLDCPFAAFPPTMLLLFVNLDFSPTKDV